MEITLYNRQRKVPVSLPWFRRFAVIALQEALPHVHAPQAPLRGLPEVEISFVSDAVIAKVHRDFMNIPGATDVITFDHGEIVISPETARANGLLYGRSLRDELALYILHGLLHLNGFKDKEPEEAALMHRLQEELLAKCLAQCGKDGE